MRKEQDAYRSDFVDLLVERGYGFFEHAPVCRQDGPAEVLLCSSSSQFQGPPPLFSDSGFRCHRRLQWRCAALRFFLLGFNELRIESSGHEAIVIMSGSVVRDAGSVVRNAGSVVGDPVSVVRPERSHWRSGHRIPDTGSRSTNPTRNL